MDALGWCSQFGCADSAEVDAAARASRRALWGGPLSPPGAGRVRRSLGVKEDNVQRSNPRPFKRL